MNSLEKEDLLYFYSIFYIINEIIPVLYVLKNV